MFYVYLIASAALTAIISLTGIVISPVDFWKPILIFAALFIGFVLLHAIAFILFSLTASKDEPPQKIDNPYRKFMITSLRLFFHLSRTHIHVEGKEKIPDDKQFLLVCNHISIYDPMITLVSIGDKGLSFVSKKENLDVPFAGRYMFQAGSIPLDREDNRQAVTAINLASEKIKSGMCAVGIYPEGWVNLTGRGLKEFRSGAFKIAKKAKVPIVVAVVENTREISDHILSRRKDVYLKILEVIDYSEIAELKTNEISEHVHAKMLAQLTEDGLN